MKLRIARHGVLLAAALGLLATMVPSAQATTIKLIMFTGFWNLSNGLGYPCTPSNLQQCPPNGVPEFKTGPKNEPQFNIPPQGNHAGFTFTSAACIKTSASSIDKANPKTSPADLCRLEASGVVWGFCGLSTGIGVATLTNPNKNPHTISTSIKFTEVGGVYYVTGGNKETNFYAVMHGFDNPGLLGQPSCLNKTSVTIIFTGVGSFKDCTGQVANTGVCDPT